MASLHSQRMFLATCLPHLVAACLAGQVCSSLGDEVSLVQRQARAVQPLANGRVIRPQGASSREVAQPQIPQTSLERNVEFASNAAGMMASDATSLVAELQALDLAIHHGSVPPSLAVRGMSSLDTLHQDTKRVPTTPPEASVDMSSQPVANNTNKSTEHDVLPPAVSDFITLGGRLSERSSIFVVTGLLALLSIALLGCYCAYLRPSTPTRPKLAPAMTSAAGVGASNTSLPDAQKAARESGWEYH